MSFISSDTNENMSRQKALFQTGWCQNSPFRHSVWCQEHITLPSWASEWQHICVCRLKVNKKVQQYKVISVAWSIHCHAPLACSSMAPKSWPCCYCSLAQSFVLTHTATSSRFSYLSFSLNYWKIGLLVCPVTYELSRGMKLWKGRAFGRLEVDR